MAETAKIILAAEDRTAQAFSSLRAGLTGATNQATALRGVFSSLVPALSFAGAATFIKGINDGVDALNDLKDATGASIGNISALEDVAARTGTSMDTVGASLVKFNQVLNEATPDSKQAQALKSIGLEAEALKKLDPAEALRQTAVALSKYADDGKRARLVQEAFGKSVREIGPFLKDLAEQTELVGKVTEEQAAEAEKFNKELFALQKNAKDAGRALTADLVKGLNEAAKAFREGGFADGMKTLIGGNDEYQASKQLADGVERLLNLEKALADAKANGYPEGSRVMQNLLEQKRQTEENISLAQNYLKVLRGDVSLTGAKPKPDERPSVDYNPEAGKTAAADKKQLAAMREAGRKALLESENRVLAAGWEEMERRADEQREAALKARKEMQDAREKEMQQWFEGIDMEQEAAIEAGRELIDAASRDAKELKAAGADIGYAFSSAFEDAILDGKEMHEVIQGLLRDIAQIALREAFTKPVGAAVAGYVGSLFADGGVMTSAGPLPLRTYAGGGVANSPQLAIFGEGSMNEAYVPLPDGRRIPVALQGGGSQVAQITYAPQINIEARTDSRQVYELVDRAVRNGNAQLVDQLQRRGRI